MNKNELIEMAANPGSQSLDKYERALKSALFIIEGLEIKLEIAEKRLKMFDSLENLKGLE
jgi:hypothetical protein